MLRLREIIPALTLRALDGRTVGAWDFKQKKNLVIVFLDAGCAPCEEFLRRLVAEAAAWRSNGAAVLAAFLRKPSRRLGDFLPENVVVGVDASGRGASAYLGRDPLNPAGEGRLGVFVADRYGELFSQWEIGPISPSPRSATSAGCVARVLRSSGLCSSGL